MDVVMELQVGGLRLEVRSGDGWAWMASYMCAVMYRILASFMVQLAACSNILVVSIRPRLINDCTSH